LEPGALQLVALHLVAYMKTNWLNIRYSFIHIIAP
jgi:hypothetical protein